MKSTRAEMDEACARAWANRLRVEPIIKRDLVANGIERERKKESVERHKDRMRLAQEKKVARAIKNLFS